MLKDTRYLRDIFVFIRVFGSDRVAIDKGQIDKMNDNLIVSNCLFSISLWHKVKKVCVARLQCELFQAE